MNCKYDSLECDKIDTSGMDVTPCKDCLRYFNRGRKVFVLGSTGMIGKYVVKYLKDSIGVTREQVNAMVTRKDLFRHQFQLLGVSNGDVVINLIGLTNKQNNDSWEFIHINSLFPRLLADYCEEIGAKMIHVSSDCVFSGTEGCYGESDIADDPNIYGISKAAGEPRNCTVIRTSVIGENKDNNKDLLEWVRNNPNDVIEGWADHLWNGTTCLQFAKVCEYIINKDRFWLGVKHIHSPYPYLSKAELISLIIEVYDLKKEVRMFSTGQACNRTLMSCRDEFYIPVPPLKEQLIEQKNFQW
jgi:dTDP-4-dehydrorhamnose reductase